MKKCNYCNAKFADEDAYEIHLGVGAPVFHTCHDENEMGNDGMHQLPDGQWAIDPSLIVHQDKAHTLEKYARLKRNLAKPDEWE